ncbi:MAG: nucleotide sugar dehydrogenase [Oceanicoccus sp.]|uniref:nucleotide sugar dehydrogenase n=2 Tax=Oceanicoccus sp. TaxID=2691044 RepID=UPI002630A1D0|nr:nucleotide sugar dehydrogenase [Oceanicoccus sp.]MDG1773447.1 nucleotide sugar dehydrogenase [Oceanicoccus sp.]
MKKLSDVKLAIIGLGYVGLPLAVEFGKHIQTIGYDIDSSRISELQKGYDRTNETTADELGQSSLLEISNTKELLRTADVFIVTVPTPIDEDKRPDLTPLNAASELVGDVISQGAIVIYESTVYPGCTEEFCVPIIEQCSGLALNSGFYAGYSPERINPGDREHRLTNVTKITSGSTPEVADYIGELYDTIVEVGTHRASSIKVAEAAKVIENVQRDVNIALVNELALVFKNLSIDTNDVLIAAGTKWNFLPFRPGLVGGHCIGVDPYYLYTKSERAGYKPRIISEAREINESIGNVISSEVISLMTQKRIHIVDAKILVLGVTFKENCPDLRNTRVIDIIRSLEKNNANVDVYDPWVGHDEEIKQRHNLSLVEKPKPNTYDAVILAVSHNEFAAMKPEEIVALGKSQAVIYDVKSVLPKDICDGWL